MKTNLILFVSVLLLLFCSKTTAQEFKLGKVSIAELQEKEHPKDPSAVAAILFKKGEVRFDYSDQRGFEVETVVSARIKIYKKEGYDWANQAVRYLLDSGLNEVIYFSDAVTYNLVEGKIEKTKLKSDGQFTEKINKYWGEKKIALPNVKEGSVIEFQYKIKTGVISYLRDWEFQASIPVNYTELTTFIPEYYNYKTNQKGFLTLSKTSQEAKRIVNYTSVDDNKDGLPPVRNKHSFNFMETKTSYVGIDLPAMKEEAFVSNLDNYTSSISHELMMTNFPNSPSKKYATNWESVVKTIYEYEDFGAELNKTGYFEADIKKVLEGLTTRNEKIEAIFNYVKNAVKWNGISNYYCNDGVKSAFKNKTGNTAEINLMLTAMLRYAELDANPVLVSTRDNGIAFFPSRMAYNAVVVSVATEEGPILLDATQKYSAPNVLPIKDLNWMGRLIRKDGTSEEIDLMPKGLSVEGVNMNVVLKNDGVAEGKIRRQLMTHEALVFREQNLELSKDSYLEKLEKENNSIEINDYVRDNELDLTKPLVESYSYKDSRDIERINDKMYISPLLFMAVKENPFKQDVREYPVDFSYPSVSKYNVNIEIPEGYVVESMPAPMNIAMENNITSFKYAIVNTDNKISAVIISSIATPIVSADYYPDLKAYFQQIIDKQNEKIILKKL